MSNNAPIRTLDPRADTSAIFLRRITTALRAATPEIQRLRPPRFDGMRPNLNPKNLSYLYAAGKRREPDLRRPAIFGPAVG